MTKGIGIKMPINKNTINKFMKEIAKKQGLPRIHSRKPGEALRIREKINNLLPKALQMNIEKIARQGAQWPMFLRRASVIIENNFLDNFTKLLKDDLLSISKITLSSVKSEVKKLAASQVKLFNSGLKLMTERRSLNTIFNACCNDKSKIETAISIGKFDEIINLSAWGKKKGLFSVFSMLGLTKQESEKIYKKARGSSIIFKLGDFTLSMHKEDFVLSFRGYRLRTISSGSLIENFKDGLEVFLNLQRFRDIKAADAFLKFLRLSNRIPSKLIWEDVASELQRQFGSIEGFLHTSPEDCAKVDSSLNPETPVLS